MTRMTRIVETATPAIRPAFSSSSDLTVSAKIFYYTYIHKYIHTHMHIIV